MNGSFVGKELKDRYTQRCLTVQGSNNVDGAPAFQYGWLYNQRLWFF